MNLDNNVYIAAINHGIAKMGEGVSYNEMKTYLKNQTFPIQDSLEPFFKVWFYYSFFIGTNSDIYCNL